MINLVFIVSSLRYKSGTERVVCQLANSFVNLDYKVTILNRDTTETLVAYPLDDKVVVKDFAGNYLSFYKQTNNYINTAKPDIIVVHNMGKLSLLSSFLSIPSNCQLVSLEHVAFLSRAKWVQFLYKFRASKFNKIITLTQNDKMQFDSFHKNVLVIPNFSPFPIASTINKHNQKIVTIGRLTDQKNYIHLLRAWEKIYTSIPNWKLHIYGEGEQFGMLQEYIDKNVLQNVTLKGVTSDVKSVYEESSFFVMSSKYEGLPMVLIEAQSFGLPIVSYDCPNGPSDVIQNGQNGLLIKTQDIPGLAKAMLELASSPDLLTQFSKNSLLNARKYQVEQIINIWVERVLKG